MIPLSSAISSGLIFTKIPRTRTYELRQDNQVVGTLERPSFWRSKFDAKTAGGHWIFRRAGFLGTGARIVDAGSGQLFAAFKSKWGTGGVLTFADGQTLRLQCRGWWRPVWTVTGEIGQPVLQLRKREKTVVFPAGGVISDDRLLLLSMFVWFRVLQAEEDAASAAVVGVIAAS